MNEFPEEHDRRAEQQESDRRKDLVARSRLEVIQENYTNWAHRSLLILGTILVAFLVQGIVGTWLYYEIKQAQKNNCLSINARYDNAIRALKEGSDQDIRNAPTAAMKIEIARRRDVTVKLIEAVAPKRDCDNI